MGLEMFRLEGKTALVTGGSKGLGEAMARALAGAGADIVICSRHLKEAEQTAASIASQSGRRVVALEADVSQRDQVEAIVERALAECGKIDILINNAGFGRKDAMLEGDDGYWEQVLAVNVRGPMYCARAVGRHMAERRVNVRGPMYCARAVGRHMAERRSGKIINIGSVYSLIGSNGKGVYAMTKGAVLQMTRSLALEWAQYNIQVNIICPGSFYTQSNAAALSKPEVLEMLNKKIPMGRSGQPEELGGAAIFLASDASSYVTGAVFAVDGGVTAQ
jgi:NAD(P)-dependent dehydrogenase (short-subunit alcohol dehydrogenase family)